MSLLAASVYPSVQLKKCKVVHVANTGDARGCKLPQADRTLTPVHLMSGRRNSMWLGMEGWPG